MQVVEVSGLADLPSLASVQFHAEWLPRLAAAQDDLVVQFPAADHTHTGWRLAVVQSLAREHAPHRANAISGGDAAAREAACRYLAEAEGITGQYLPLDDAGAGPVLGLQG